MEIPIASYTELQDIWVDECLTIIVESYISQNINRSNWLDSVKDSMNDYDWVQLIDEKCIRGG